MGSIFLTGASGYIGGQVLNEIIQNSPDQPITLLLRDEHKAKLIRDKFKKVNVVIGDLDDDDLLEREASKASIVLHLASAGHLKSVQSIHRGLKKRQASEPAYWIQVSGASALAAAELASPSFSPGSGSSDVFDDIEDASKFIKLLRDHKTRAVDNYILYVGSQEPSIETALVFPPIIYGVGEGVTNQRSIQIPELARVTLERGHGVRVGPGLNKWGNVHIRDLGRLFGALVDATSKPKSDFKLWNKDGLYLTGVGEISFGEISEKVARTAVEQGFNTKDTVEELHKPDIDTVLPHGSVIYGTNARSKARRAREHLGWTPREESLEADIPNTVAIEAKRRQN
ncbi:hypothetical protein PFICI_02202 [Pestalotiopsis fici W106-1]|uniref:NAD(P)-binding domain-containing protein n=1 Tax=Pestalotiopsis fici (strain W106-1 / CGMCC3.15140) TaxID=1229662 RepID=W3XFH5_PESFW|nr:uncharacterized protein PFICI_02202 [Pestalotiopsis fici W106-1]ETS84177.1 hypothetical protein PFICI_02202 [Pestalotiopsis fici W106-1]